MKERATPINLTLREVTMLRDALSAIVAHRPDVRKLHKRFSELVPVLEELQPVEKPWGTPYRELTDAEQAAEDRTWD